MSYPTDNHTNNAPSDPFDPNDIAAAQAPLEDQPTRLNIPDFSPRASSTPPNGAGQTGGQADQTDQTDQAQANAQTSAQSSAQASAAQAQAGDTPPGEPAEDTAPLPTPPSGARTDYSRNSRQADPPVRRSGPGWVALTLVALLMLILGTGLGVGLVKASPASFRAFNFPGSSQTTTTPTATVTPQGLVGTPAPTIAVPPSASDLQQTIINVIRTVQPSVVEVTAVGTPGSSTGSGEIVSGAGYIVTNDHVVSGYTTYSVTLSNGQTYPATLTGQDAADDLAVLKITPPTTLQPINFGDSNKVQVGEFVVALGSPLGLQQSATFGIVSALNRTASDQPQGSSGQTVTLSGLIQTSAPTNHGNSGGALVDLSGNLIGVPTLGAVDNSGTPADGISFAIPSDRVQFAATQLIKYGKVTNPGQGFLGVQGEDVTPQLAQADNLSVQSGILVTGFANDAAGASPAEQAGMKIGDIITGADGQTINSNGDLSAILLNKQPGAQITLVVVRGSTQLNITVTLGQRPTNS